MARWFRELDVSGHEEVRIAFPSGIRSLPFVAVIALGLQSAGLTAPLPEWLRFGIAIITLVWLPGVFVERLIRPALPWSALRLPLTFFLGASLLTLLASAVMIFNGSFGLFEALVQLFAAALYVFMLIRPPRSTGGWKFPYGIALLVVALGVIVALAPPQFDVSEDAYDHIGYLRHIVSENSLEPTGVLAPLPDGVPMPDPRKGAFHAVVAAVSSVSGVDPLALWTMLPVFVFPLAFVAFIGFCRPFVEHRWQLIACAILFGLSYGGIGFQFAEASAYGQNLAVAWYWLVVGVVLGMGSLLSRREIVVIVLLVGGGVLSHLGVALHAGIVAASIGLFPGVFGLERRLGRRIAMTILLTVVVAGTWKFAHTYAPTNEIHSHPQGLLYWSKRLVTASPAEVIRHHGMLFFGGLVVVPVLLFFRRRALAGRHLVMALIPLCMSFIPWVATPLFHIGSYMVFRSLLGIPVFALICVLAGWLFGRAREGTLATKALVAVAMFLWALAFLSPTLRAAGTALRGQKPSTPFTETHGDLVRYLNTLPVGVILSDPKTSYALSALTDHRFVVIHGQHATPGDPNAMERLADTRDALSPFTRGENVIDACDRFDVAYVVLDGRTGTRASEFLSMWDQSFFGFTVTKLMGIAGRFRVTFKADGVVVFLYDPAGTGEIKWSAPMAPFAPVGGDPVRCVVDAPDREYSVTSISIEPDRLLPGEEMAITIGYEKYDAGPFRFPTVVHLRFDHESVSQDHRYPGEKHVRRINEMRAGRLVRFRRDITPYQGLIPLEVWPIGTPFYDRVVVKVPPAMALGNYRLEIAIDRQTLLPNLEVGDLLYNRDHFSGKSCVGFELVGSVVRQ